ncbi:MAG: peptidylprolyl isomerase [Bacteroidota bacterium]
MSALSRIRQNMGLIVIVIFVALAAFILTDFFQGISTTLAGPMDAGTVAGESVSFQEYQTMASQQIQNAGINSSDELQAGQLRDAVWNQMVSDRVLESELDKIGLQITPQEAYDMFAGEEISPLIRQYILPPGQPYDQANMKNLLSQIQTNPAQRQQLRQLEEYAVQARGRERYLNMVKAGFIGSDAFAKAKYAEQNRSVDLSYLAVNYNAIPDSQIEVSDRELRTYMQNNKDQYEQDAQTVVRYARFSLAPSKKDSIQARQTLESLTGTFAETEDDSSFTSLKSRIPYGQNYQPIYQLPEVVRDEFVNASDQTVIGPFLEGDAYSLYKLVGTEASENPSAKIRHILVQFTSDTSAVRSEAAGFARQVRGGADFATLASENSDDFSSRSNGGELGWYSRGQFGEDFDKAIDAAGKGSIIGPIKGRGGFHVVEVLDKSSKNYDIAKIEELISYSSTTRDSVYGKANYFAAALLQSQDINEAANQEGVVAFASNPFTEEDRDVQGLNGGRELILWGTNADLGDISKVLRVNDNYVIAQVTEKRPEGLQDLEEVRDEVFAEVAKEKKADQIIQQLKSAGGSDLNAMKDAYGPAAVVSSSAGVTFATSNIAGIGRDPFLIGKALSLEQGALSSPIAGENGVYVLQVTNVTEPAEADATVLAGLKSQETSSGQLSLQSRVISGLIDIADVEDNRAKVEARNYGFR